jgi:hypothetical protein
MVWLQADFFDSRFALVFALRARVSRFALCLANPPVLQATKSTTLVPASWLTWKDWEEPITKRFNLLARKNVSSNQFTNIYKTQNSQQTWTSPGTSIFELCGARTNKGGINLNIELKRRKAQSNWCKKHNFDDTERLSKILEVKLQQSLTTPDKAKYDIHANKQHNFQEL